MTLAVLSLPGKAAACSGPCADPTIHDLAVVDGSVIAATNFGILKQENDGFRLDCEEAIGGLLLKALFGAGTTAVSTSLGFFLDTSQCEWSPVSSPSNDWFLDVASFDREDGGRDLFGLIIDTTTYEVEVQRSRNGEPFQTVTAFPQGSGYRWLRLGSSAPSLFVVGTTPEPPTLHIASALDGGETWEQAAFEIRRDDPERSPLVVLPGLGHELLIRGAYLASGVDELWSFNAEDRTLTTLQRLPEGQRISAMARDGLDLYLVGRGDTHSTIYRLAREPLALEAMVSVSARVTCLTFDAGILFVCNDDFTSNAEWLIGSSRDGGQSFQPAMRLADLGAVTSCNDACEATTSWLQGAYGGLGTNVATFADAGTDARADGQQDVPDEGRRPPEARCRLGPAVRASAPVDGLVLLLATLGLGAARWFRPRPANSCRES